MTDYIHDTPQQGISWCPGCAPERDPTAEVLDVRYCDAHAPKQAGVEDDKVIASGFLSGNGDVDGTTNRAWCELLSRPNKTLDHLKKKRRS